MVDHASQSLALTLFVADDPACCNNSPSERLTLKSIQRYAAAMAGKAGPILRWLIASASV
jgi:hypothetical protein